MQLVHYIPHAFPVTSSAAAFIDSRRPIVRGKASAEPISGVTVLYTEADYTAARYLGLR